jgi:large subunit ribosomal protein L6
MSRSLHGLTRTLINNMVQSASPRATRRRWRSSAPVTACRPRAANLEFALGYSHPITVEPPDGITFVVEAPTRFSVQGIDKQQVGEVAANIRKLRKPDPYKGKGVRYEGEQIRRKVGKAGKK